MNPLLPGQPLKVVGPVYDVTALTRELTNLHQRINSIIQNPALATVPALNVLPASPATTKLPAVKSNYVAGDLGTAAAIAQAINAQAVAINTLSASINGLLLVFNSTGTQGTSGA